MRYFISFNGDTIWWNTSLFHKIGVGYGKYGFRDGNVYPHHRKNPAIQATRTDHWINGEETIMLTDNLPEKRLDKILEMHSEIIKNPISERMIFENGGETFDPRLFYRIEIVRLEPTDGHNRITWTEYEILGRYIDKNNSQWTEKYDVDETHNWYGSELLYSSDTYGDCEKVAEDCEHLINLAEVIKNEATKF